ncbi:GL11568 [Drosophila persimilis]|uniref:GL11568 n=1 Tax=Drosophila persimilis TaxID=7234 RepID=B4GBQ1_DROPE|nr:GL11568 [Drosophila persimilis]
MSDRKAISVLKRKVDIIWSSRFAHFLQRCPAWILRQLLRDQRARGHQVYAVYQAAGEFYLETNGAKPFGRNSRSQAIVLLAPQLPIAYKLPPIASRPTVQSQSQSPSVNQYGPAGQDPLQEEDENNSIDSSSLT